MPDKEVTLFTSQVGSEILDVGSEVIVTEGVKNCYYGYNRYMTGFIGKKVHISSYTMRDYSPTYRVEEDDGNWLWDNNCFGVEKAVELNSFEPECVDALVDMLM